MTAATRPGSTISRSWSFQQDLDDILIRMDHLWPDLRGARLFMTGGTGFIGCWLLEALRHANIAHQLGLHVTILTRNPGDFSRKAPHLTAYEHFRFLQGNVAEFPIPDGDFSHVIHAATDASADLNDNNPRLMFETIMQGTRRTLDVAVEKKAERTLFLSSGAVYGQQPWEMECVGEDWLGALDCTNAKNAYGEGKRGAEMLCAIYRKQFGVHITTARIFSLLGPHLPLGVHFAAGNFILDAMQGKTVVVQGDGRPHRSYLYTSDLTVWLLHLLLRGKPVSYNVGSDESVSIADLARLVSQTIGNGQFEILGKSDSGWNPGRYVPKTELVGNELDLYRTVSLTEAIRRTATWNGWRG
ncbi:NAD-dependent epimerase/dehydratase family protein [Tardiphaga sp.]|uniref:NAD-dependent epimerase/dehydratase family protein n=1 Tax=Tardiphaga sp. TaxID=1926292 RepID=UPI0026111B56|nr:NAD-dependent epimerase/dehydratase family protein [Tardiphaga sp.]MDB5619761.1 putative dTDPglucose 4,6-dehydratase [Tardiphaga sp.]